MMKHYIYRLTVGRKEYDEQWGKVTTRIKSFLGNDKNDLYERFERWFIKQPLTREEIEVDIEYVQHANNRI